MFISRSTDIIKTAFDRMEKEAGLRSFWRRVTGAERKANMAEIERLSQETKQLESKVKELTSAINSHNERASKFLTSLYDLAQRHKLKTALAVLGIAGYGGLHGYNIARKHMSTKTEKR